MKFLPLRHGYDWLYQQSLQVCRALTKAPETAPAAAVALLTAVECWYVFGLLLISDALLSTRLLGTGGRVGLQLGVITLALGAGNALYLAKRNAAASQPAAARRPDNLWIMLILGSLLVLTLGFLLTRRALGAA